MIIDSLVLKQSKNTSKEKTPASAEKPMRSIVKSISWRAIGTLDTIAISWFVTGTLALALSIGAVELVSKMALYFFHERVWNLIKWGK
ncbi:MULTISPECIES: DUF2061 domain-containing protein [unclassified Dokdonia]|uniref:DUF2061 domain-containing protein n=1 Tax=unclassified Dokdonia TaxID=2615033 RepID=UPI001951B1DE|nr:DUF2061 domain-containing protein [Dokdonia sp. Dokd-P16]|tara:strand:- start:39266 stop:39529 length:264 start_codon:yes stop_codon:yes gene_type:complete